MGAQYISYGTVHNGVAAIVLYAGVSLWCLPAHWKETLAQL